MSEKYTKYETLSVEVSRNFVYHVQLNRPDKLNSMNRTMWIELGQLFEQVNEDVECRVVVLSGAGKLFTAGLDFGTASEILKCAGAEEDLARKARTLESLVGKFQRGITHVDLCSKPVLVAVHGACIGGGMSLITAADIRYCTRDAWFQVKEVDLGIAADMGVLQRMPKMIGSDGLVRELCYTGRKMMAKEARECGLINCVYDDKDGMLKAVMAIADDIAAKSPVAVQGTKRSLVFSRDHTVQNGLDHIALWNGYAFQSEDFLKAATGVLNNQTKVEFKPY